MRISNPDDKISVPTVCDSIVTVYGPLFEGATERRREYSRTFGSYGKAKLWADEFLDAQRNGFRPQAK